MTASTISAAALALLTAMSAPAAAGPAHGAPLSAAEPATRCTFSDPRLQETSGLAETSTGFVAINDSNFEPSKIRIFFLNRSCKIVRSVGYPTAARDPEDLAIDQNGRVWVADIGDNVTADTRRETIALWRLDPAEAKPTIFRLRYPDGPHDAEALVVTADGVPVIITKELQGPAGVYAPSEELIPNDDKGVALTRVGQFTPQATGTSNPYGASGNNLVTGAAFAPDARHVVIRTYSDAYEFLAPNGDIVKAITTGTPTITPLPDEPQGEAIAYARDGKNFLTVSDAAEPTPLLAYAIAPRPDPTGPAVADPENAAGSGGLTWLWVTIAAVTGVLGLGALVAGLVGVRRARRGADDAERRESVVPTSPAVRSRR
ncbi:hypothetical protein GCM10009682_44920 [Luedemannella flava]|uniref:Uncharacterized protein n=1 Tax=Luedemannella flava TaxID=349316 RepID=A0ABN2MBP4_9ACTN